LSHRDIADCPKAGDKPGLGAREMIIMSAIHFEAVVENDTIRIPEQFRTSVRKGKVQVTIREDVSENKNAMAWQRFLKGIKACEDHDLIEFDRVNFDREVVL
jgi:hypothetical protein